MKKIKILKKVLIKNEGMTLIELMVAINLLIIILIPIYSFYMDSLEIMNILNLKEESIIIVQREMEQLQAKPFLELEPGKNEKEIIAGDFKYICEIEITDLEAWLKEVKINIYNQQRELVSLKNRIIRRN